MGQETLAKLRTLLTATHILIVDDTPIIRDIVAGILEPLHLAAVHQAGNGEEAWKLLESESIDLVIADWLMPGLNGLDLLRKMRESERFATTPLIMITGMPDRHVVVEAMKLSISDFLIKPIDGNLLRQKILKVLSAKAAQ